MKYYNPLIPKILGRLSSPEFRDNKEVKKYVFPILQYAYEEEQRIRKILRELGIEDENN